MSPIHCVVHKASRDQMLNKYTQIHTKKVMQCFGSFTYCHSTVQTLVTADQMYGREIFWLSKPPEH